MPAELTPFGTIPGDAVMKPALSDGDLCIQACADDPQVVFHAVRNLVRAARGTAVLKWSQLGFGRASATGAGQTTPRNLMGFKDGTNNIHADDTAALRRAGLGRPTVRPSRGWRRHLPGRAQDPDGDRVLGHRPADRSGADLRPEQGHRRAADRR